MKFAVIKLTVLVLIAAIISPAVINNKSVSAQNGDEEATPTAQEQSADVTYSYVAQAGDSYTKLARKAVQTYGAKYSVDISQAGIIFAETNLAQQAGSPLLDLGQKVDIKESVVKDWADKALGLSADQKAAWGHYAQFVNFDTSQVGEAK